MTKYNKVKMSFKGLKGKKVQADFKGGQITSDGGALLLREIDNKLKLTKKAAGLINDKRDKRKIKHSVLSMLRQRIYGIAQGYEDLNDHNELRKDPAFQTALNQESEPGSSPTLCRFENSIDKKSVVNLHKLMLEPFMDSFDNPPECLILDFDATDDRVHGNQEGKFYHGYYRHYCFLPLYVFCESQLLVSYLRPSNIDGAKHSWAILALLVKAFRKRWPDVEIVFRADSGFCRHLLFNWCERNSVGYIVGLPGNDVLKDKSSFQRFTVGILHSHSGEMETLIDEFYYAAKTWTKERRVIVKTERNALGPNTRYVVTNLDGLPDELYEKVYCLRGRMEQSIGEQLSFCSDRTSCHAWLANQFRLTLTSLAYILVDALRRLALADTKMANCRVDTIRLKLLKVGALIVTNTRRIVFKLSENYVYKDLFICAYRKLCPG